VIKMLMIHSPLVGPLTLAPLAAELRDRGFDVAVPDLRSALTQTRPVWRAIIDLALVAAEENAVDVIVGHSGAGVLLPLLAERLDPAVVVYVDAVVPGSGAIYEPTREFLDFIDSLPRNDELLPPWHSWWGEETMIRLIPDQELRAHVITETPSVPRSLYDDPVPLPSGWATRAGCCYLQISPAYQNDLARSRTYGWPIAHINGQHLDVTAKPNEVAPPLIDLIDRTRSR
jgi:hypothetical protein